ncbi:MAG: mechanosensitive ion channel [Lysobacterales bacterium]|jgi:small-conductance mechanosensitive channel
MAWFDWLQEHLVPFLPVLVVLAVIIVVLAVTDRLLKRRWREQPEMQFRFQMIMLALTFCSVLAVLLALPLSDTVQGQLLTLIGILLSAAIALSATTFIGNIMAGIMLKAIKSIRPGDFLEIADITGRVTEMSLLHTEVQTEDRDLVTVPNLYMVTNPMKVVRPSGTIVSAEVSLGYDIPRTRVSKLLRQAARNTGLSDSFIHVRELGDFAVTYRIAGLLEDVKSLISVRTKLREEMLDVLHGAGIEIVSPAFMNTRPIGEDRVFIPPLAKDTETPTVSHEEVAFDKAEVAASVEEVRKAIEAVEKELEALVSGAEDTDREAIQKASARLEARKEVLMDQLKAAEERRKEAEDSD